MSNVLHLTKDNFEKEVKGDGVAVVDFWAAWCEPCKMIAPVLDELSLEMDNVKITKVNVDEEGELATEFKIRSIPTLLVFKDGQIVDQIVGALPKATLKAKIEANL